MRNIVFVTDNYYHIFNRGVEGRKIFLDNADYRRFYESLFLFNDADYLSAGGPAGFREKEVEESLNHMTGRKSLVGIAAFCLMPTHFHLLLKQLGDGNISRFMHRLPMGYARYFNIRYERRGRLFEDTFKAVHVIRDSHFRLLPAYIHLNVLDLHGIPWREGNLRDWRACEKLLNDYLWSSHGAYRGTPEALPVIDRQAVGEIYESKTDYMSFLKSWSGSDAPISSLPSLSYITK